jgi:23S rRNA (cytidine1920-2'-O)/16S rRNA (cytidine1409-2'-O)-methyltransferase
MGAHRSRYVNVLDHVRQVRPDIIDPISAIERRQLLVGGRIVISPHSLVAQDAPVAIRRPTQLRGEGKLEAALDSFDVNVFGRTCLDLGASAGGFTRVLLRAGAARVFAVDAGHGQLRGDLRIDSRVVNLERTNAADIANVLPARATIDVFTIDLSYLSIADAVPQLETLPLAASADLIALVKPMFELHLPFPPTEERELERALTEATHAVEGDRRWGVVATIRSPILGSKGAREWLLHARRVSM